MEPGPEDRLFLRWRETGDGDALAEVYDRTAPALLRVAMHLVRHPAHAEDLLQTTFLAAIENAARYDPARPVIGWLIGILHNQARKLLRSEGRTGEAERLQERTPDDPLAAVQAAELTSQVDEAIERLSEVYQPVLRLHLKHHFTAAEIAHVLGRPPGTVRKQVVRGLELLRNLLPVSLAVGALALVTPVRGLAAVREVVLLEGRATAATAVGATGGAVGTLILGVLTMKKTVLATAAVLALAAGGWWITSIASPWDTAHGAPASLASVASAPETRSGSGRESASMPEDAGVRRALAADEAWGVRGRALRAAGKPYPNVHVKARLFRGYSAKGQPLLETRLVSDETGALVWTMPEPRETVTFRFEPDEPRHVGSGVTVRAVVGDPAPDPFRVWLFPLDSRVVGTVADEQGRPVAGARIRSHFALETSCDEAGAFSLEVPSFTSGLEVTASAPGHAGAREHVTFAAGGEARADFRLRRGFRVFGKIRDEAGTPIAGAEVRSTLHGLPPPATTATDEAHDQSDVSGAYELTNLEPGKDVYFVYVRCSGYTSVSMRLAVPPGAHENEHDFTLRRGVRVEGIVFGPTGAPARGAEISLGRLDAMSGDDGAFAFPAVPPGRHVMVTQRRGLAPDRRMLDAPEGVPVVYGVEIRLGEGHFVSGNIQDEEGKRLSGIGIAPRMHGEYLMHSSTQTDASGGFHIVGLPAGTIELEAYAAGYVRQNTFGITVDRADVVIRLERAAGLAGTVVDGDTGAPVQRFRIRFVEPTLPPGEQRGWGYGSGWTDEGKLFHDAAGTWETSGEQLRPGDVFGVEASAPGYAAGIAEHVVAKTGARAGDLTIRLFRGSTLTGRVVEAESASAIAGVTLTLFTTKNPPRSEDPDAPDGRHVARSDQQGNFRFEHVPAGEVSLLVRHPAWSVRVHGPVPVTRGVDVPGIVIGLDRGARIEGVVLDFERRPIANAHVSLTAVDVSASPDERRETDAGEQGRFSFDSLSAGVYLLACKVRVGGISIVAHARHVRIERSVAQLELAPDLGTSSVRGSVVARGELPGNLKVTVARVEDGLAEVPWEKRFPAWEAFVRDGRFELRGIPAGSYWASVSMVGAVQGKPWSGAATFFVSGGGSAEIQIELTRSAPR